MDLVALRCEHCTTIGSACGVEKDVIRKQLGVCWTGDAMDVHSRMKTAKDPGHYRERLHTRMQLGPSTARPLELLAVDGP